MKKSYEIVVAGQKLVVKSDDDEARVQAVARLLDERVSKVQRAGVASSQRALLLAALGIAEDYVALEAKHHELKAAIFDRAQKLLTLVRTLRARREATSDDVADGNGKRGGAKQPTFS